MLFIIQLHALNKDIRIIPISHSSLQNEIQQ